MDRGAMIKKEFDRQKQMLWVYLRHQGKCTQCGQKVDLHENALSKAVPMALGIDHLLRVQLVHSHCEASASPPSRLAAA
jgi:hypothetical protein